MKKLFALFWLTPFFALLHAQQTTGAAPVYPGGPAVLTRAPSLSQWTITTSQYPPPSPATTSSAQDHPTASSKQITVTNTETIRRRQTLLPNGQVWTIWCVKDLQFVVYPTGEVLACTKPTGPDIDTDFYADYSSTDFPEFSWVSAKNFVEIHKYGGQPCLHYQSQIKINRFGDQTNAEAYVALDTRLPVLFIGQGESHAYAFGPAPTSQLDLPDPVKKVLADRKRTAVTHQLPQL